MHPDISKHLKFKYENLVDNLSRVLDKEPASVFGIQEILTNISSSSSSTVTNNIKNIRLRSSSKSD